MNDFRQPAFRFYDRHLVTRRRVARPFRLDPVLASFHSYDSLIRHIMKKASRMGLEEAKLRNFEKSLKEIASSLERLKMEVGNEGHPGNKKMALCLISEIAFCYNDPVKAIESLNSSYALIVKMADRVREGRLKPVPENFERRAGECSANAKFLCSVSGLRQLRREASGGEPRNSTCPLPEISNHGLIGYVNVKPSLQNGRGVTSRRPVRIDSAGGEEKGNYTKTLKIISDRLTFADRANATWIRVVVHEIADLISEIPLGVDKRRMLCLIAETCVLYKNPSSILYGFRSSYEVLKEIMKTVDAGRKYSISMGKEKEADHFAQRVRMFGSIQGLIRIRTNAALSMNGSGSTYEIEFLGMQELREISYGKGQEVQFP